MASNLGSVFVEISLDDKIYKQKLSETLTSTEATAKGIETSWKVLGTKNDASFDAQRRSYENAMTLIKNSATATAADIIRAEEAKNAKIKALNDQQYGHQASMLDTLKANWIAASAAIYAAWSTAMKVWDMAEVAAGYLEQMQQLDSLAQAYGTTSHIIVSKISEVSEGMISMKTAAEVSMSALAKALTPDQVIELAKAAVTLSDVMGTTANEAFKTLSESIETNKVKALKLAVGTIELKDNMSEAEKQAYLYNLVIKRAGELQDSMGGSSMSVADRMEALKSKFADLKIEIGIGFLRAGAAIIGTFQSMAAGVMLVASAVPKAIEFLDKLVAKFYEWTGQQGQAAALKAEAEGWKDVYVAMQKTVDDLGTKASGNFAMMTASTAELTKAQGNLNNAIKVVPELSDTAAKERIKYENEITATITKNSYDLENLSDMQADKDITRILVKVGEFEKAGVSQIKIQEYVNSEMTKLEDATSEEILKNRTELKTKSSELVGKQYEEGKAISDKAVKDAEKASEQKAQYERDLYEDIRGYEVSYYNASLVMIESQVKKYRAAGVDEVAVAAWVAEETEKSWIKMATKGDDFFAGVKAGFLEMQDKMTTWGTVGYEMFKTFSETSYSTVSSVLFDGITGNIKSLEDYFSSFFKSLLKAFTDLCGEMLVQWALVRSGLAQTIGINIGTSTVTGMTAGVTGVSGVAGAGTNATGSYAATLFGGSAGTYGASAMPSTMGVVTPYFTAGAAGYVGGSALAEAMFGSGSGTGGGIGGSVGAMAGYTFGGPLGGVVGGVIGSVIGGFIDSLFGSNAGFGSKAGNVDSRGAYGALPAYGSWAELPGAKDPAPSDLISAFMSDANDAVAYTYLKIASYANTLDEAHKTALAQGLASMGDIKYLPQLEGFTTGTPTDDSVTGIFLTRESAGLAESYVKSIPGFILSQVNPVIEYLTGNVVSAKSGLDYVPYDNFLINAHKGERVQTADERSNLAGEIKSLRAEQRETNRKMLKFAESTSTIIKRWEYGTLPPLRT